MPAFPIQINLINQQGQVLPGLTVQAWIGNQKAGEALTDAQGNCTISIALAAPGPKKLSPIAYLMVYAGEKWIYGEKDNPQYVLNGTELNLQVTIPARRADLIPMMLKDFRRSAEDLSELSAAQRNYVAGKLNAALSSAVQQALGEADTRFQETPVMLTQDYTALLNTTLGDVLKVAINTTRAFELDKNVTTRLAQNPRSVREILHIEQPMIKNPIFYEAVQVLRTTNLTDMMLPGQPHTADYLLERSLDWERASVEQWEALAAEGIVSEAGKSLLQRGFALSRFTGGQTALVGGLMQEVTDLRQMVTFDADHLLARIHAVGGETPNGETPEEYAAKLVQLAQRNYPSAFFLERKVERAMNADELSNTYRHLGVQEPAKLKMGQKHLRKFREDNTGFDLRTADFFKKDDNGKSVLKYDNIPENFKAGVRKQMMAFQRVARLAGSYEAQDALLAAGLDSSSEIMRLKPAELETMLGGSLSPAAIADIVISAEQQFEMVVNSAVAIQGISSSQSIGFAVDNYPEDLKNQLQDIDGYAEMFGSQDYCECDHCKSIFGPAAYFVDLMKFTEENVILMKWDVNKLVPLTKSEAVAHPISLRTRRPDLWDLELTCENTNAVVPYLLIINEIKQRYITEVMGGILGGKPAKDVDIWAEFARPFVSTITFGFQQTRPFAQANTWKNSFRLPFNRPFEESQILLEHFKVNYTEVLQGLQVSDPTRLAQAYLGVSAEEWQVLVIPDSSLEDLRNLRFGFPQDREKKMDVNIVLDPGYALEYCPVDDFQRATGLNRADTEFLLSGKSSLYQIPNTVKLVRNPIPGEIQQYEEWIEGLENKDVLDFIHRFLRLKQRLPWTLRELDFVVSKVGKLSPDHIVEIAEIREMQRVLQLTVEEAVAFQWAIPDTPLYTRTVYNELLNASVEVSVPGMLSRQFDLTKLPLDGSIKSLFDPHKLPFLLQGLGTTESEFEQLYRLLFGRAEMNLDLTSVSLFYRLHRMAKIFGLSGEEMAYLLKLDTSSTGTSVAAWALNVAQTIEVIRKMPLSLHEMWFVLKGEKTSKIDFQYQGDAKRQEDAEKAAQKLMTDFVQDKRLYMDAEGILKQVLPSKWFVDVALPISDNLLASKFFKKTADGNFQILKAAPLSFEDIIDRFKLKPGSNQPKPELLDENLRSSIADAFNAEWSKIRNQVFGEHLGLLLKTAEPLISGMLSWAANANLVMAEAQANFAVSIKPATYAMVELVKVLPTLERLGLIFNKIGLDAEDAVHFKNPDHLALFIQLLAGNPPNDGNNIKVIRQLATYARFKQQSGDAAGTKAYRELLNTTITEDTPIAAFSPLMASILDCEANQLTAVANILQAQVNLPLPFTPSLLRQIEEMVQVSSRLGIYELSVLNALRDNTYTAALQYEKALRTAFRAQYTTDAAYEKAWDPYENRIQELRRDVLCAFLLALDQQNRFHDTGDLYAYFLVDVEMSGCARVSRILEATLCLQTYIHRVIMGLELTQDLTPHDTVNDTIHAFLGKPDINPNLDTQAMYRKQWEWRKNYRVWEANRKVFLYPENWIEPELRHDKSPLFKTLEDELLQQKISLESAEQAYIQYLKGFAEVGQLVIAGVYFEAGEKIDIYHIFGRTATDPYQYYYRKMRVLPMNTTTKIRAKQWTAWEKVELAIDAPYVSPIMHNGNGKLNLFWIGVTTMEKTTFSSGDSQFEEFSHTITLKYSYLTENGKWLQPQQVKDFAIGQSETYPDTNNNSNKRIKSLEKLQEYESSLVRFRVFPYFENQSKQLIVDYWQRADLLRYSINTYDNKASKSLAQSPINTNELSKFLVIDKSSAAVVVPYNIGSGNYLYNTAASEIEKSANENSITDPEATSELILGCSSTEHGSEIRFIFNVYGNYIFRNNRHQYLFRQTESGEKVKSSIPNWDKPVIIDSNIESILLTTTIADELTKRLTINGISAFLNPETQVIPELNDSITFVNPGKLARPFFEFTHLDFSGAHGLYFRELFFHIPFLIANHLNAEGKYKEADYWYRKIFDPSASFDPDPQSDPKDRYWRFMEFRAQTLPVLQDILTDTAAITEYETNPFNPHAIAQVRMGPYQKAIVMKYIDNLIDWGDSLFRRDTWESNTEAMLLYQLAHDILGERPQKTGPCESAIDTNNCGCVDPKTTYAKLKGEPNQPFVYSVENWVFTPDPSIFSSKASVLSGGNVIGYEDALETAQAMGTRGMNTTREMHEPSYAVDFGGHLLSKNVFCIPGNEKIFDYWDRVEDRQYKLRHCMNIDGVKRSLALFQPPIDPALLVAAFAAGLSVEDVLNSLYGDLPAYRFSYLVEKAKAFAGTVQGFGGALLSALEKKDSEALTLLRSTQEQNILKMTKDVKKKAIEEAKANLQSTVEGMVNTMNRVLQYTEWIDENLNGWERTQQISLHTASTLSAIEPVYNIIAIISSLIPNIGSPPAMTFGGEQIEKANKNGALLIKSLANLASIISSSAGLEASFQRRAQDWKFQLKTAEQEIKQVQQQIAAATIRLAIAEKDLEIHEKQIEQAAEVHDFYKNKFTGLGLYNYMAKRLNSLHRMAFNAAMDMAKQAEAAYKFETGDDDYFEISGGAFWDASRVGLLSGESLTLQLQKLEANFINWNQRQMEIRQSFSMRMIDPESLLALRKDGICPSFTIPEWAFDMQYPGHYRRRIASVQITIPCVAGPYHNIAATLTMKNGKLKKETDKATDLFPFQGSKMMATSSANNDGGQFELNFRDERFLPFEGAGAVDSEWVLELPDKFRSFDYDTISDVIFHVSYRSKYDEGLKQSVKGSLATTVNAHNAGEGLKRLVSLKQEFPDVYFQLQQHPHEAKIVITEQLLPYFAKGAVIGTDSVKLYQPNGISISPKNAEGEVTLSGNPVKDVFLLIEYKLPS